MATIAGFTDHKSKCCRYRGEIVGKRFGYILAVLCLDPEIRHNLKAL
jgi:hypothetical protein